jgi:hypothetical protein
MNKIKHLFYIITADLKSLFYIISMKIWALFVLCGKFLYACIVEICHQSLTVFFIAIHARATQKLLQVCEQVKITWILFVLMC